MSLATAFEPDIRRSYLGCSELAAAIGIGKYQTPIEIWGRKVGVIPPLEDGPFLEWGRLLEPVLAIKYMAWMGVRLKRPTDAEPLELVHPQGWLRGHLDGIVEGIRTCPDCGTTGPAIWEAKAPGFRTAHEWGPPCSDMVPLSYGSQCQLYMNLTGIPQCDLYASIGGPDFRCYHLKADTDLAIILIEGGRRFWYDHVLTGERPPLDATRSTQAYLESMYPQSAGKTLAPPSDAANELAERLRVARANVDKWSTEKNITEAELKDLIGVHGGISGAGWSASWGNVKGSVTKGAVQKALEGMTAAYGRVLDYLTSNGIAIPNDIAKSIPSVLAEHLKPSAGHRQFRPKFEPREGDAPEEEEE